MDFDEHNREIVNCLEQIVRINMLLVRVQKEMKNSTFCGTGTIISDHFIESIPSAK